MAISLDSLKRDIIDADSRAIWFAGIRGLRLNIDLLRTLGAGPQFLRWWEHGRHFFFDADVEPNVYRNYRSLLDNLPYAEAEWDRLERFGKIRFFSPGHRPDQLLVNPCGLALKETSDNIKARMIVDFTKTGLNQVAQKIPVEYGSLDIALSRTAPGSWLFVVDLADAFLQLATSPR